MKSIKLLYFTILIVALHSTISSQSFIQRIRSTTFVFGLNEHIVIDNGREYKLKFDAKNWNLTPYPSKITAEALFKKGWGLQTEFAYTKYKANKIVDNNIQTKDNTFFCGDFHIKYHLSHLIHNLGLFDPYLTGGYGFTYRSAVNVTQTSTGTNNLGLGCNFWIYKGFGANIQLLSKYALKGGVKSNYVHHSIGIIYKLKPLSGKSR